MTNATRRSFLKRASAGVMATTTVATAQEPPPAFRQPPAAFDAVQALPFGITRPWLGPAFWANRLQDWRLHNGRIECLTGAAGDECRTVAVLTREMIAGAVTPGGQPPAAGGGAHLSVRASLLDAGERGGFCGFLIGAGAGHLDYRAAALVHKVSGTGGGFLCAYQTDGRAVFREHTDEQRPLAFAEIAGAESAPASRPQPGEEFLLRLDITPNGAAYDLAFSVWNAAGTQFRTGAMRRGVPEQELPGGIALVSSRMPGAAQGSGARFAFRDLQTGGAKLAKHPERALGPIIGTLHSVNGKVMKLSVQLMPVGDDEPREVRLQYRAVNNSILIDAPPARIEPGWVAVFRITNWDPSRAWAYRVSYGDHSYTGWVAGDPLFKDPLTIALFSCVLNVARSLDQPGQGRAELPQAEFLPRYTEKNFYFPHNALVTHTAKHKPDLVIFCGDQLYEGNPTRRDPGEAPTLDYLYKWYLWVWSFRELTRNTPAVVMPDDHDVYHGNLWGNGGRLAPQGDQNRGGYRCTGEFVNIVQRTQCAHLPDPFDPTPVDQKISVYYGAFRLGGFDFAIIEDRKFKTAPIQGADLDVHEAELLGERQERFLEEWAKREGALPRIAITQTLFACVQTSPGRKPMLDFDANGYPKLGRDKALRLLRAARAIILSGDQHLPQVVRHGIDAFEDGPIQFAGPAGGTSWQRWFEPAGDPRRFEDAFGNKVSVLAWANPRITFAEYRKHIKGRGQGLGDRRLKSEGYGIIRVNRRAQEFVIECWPWNADPAGRAARQFDGWPVKVAFEDV